MKKPSLVVRSKFGGPETVVSSGQFMLPPEDLAPHPLHESRSGVTTQADIRGGPPRGGMPTGMTTRRVNQFVADQGQAMVKEPWKMRPVTYDEDLTPGKAQAPDWLQDRYLSFVLPSGD